jgi:hypothetical protein
MDNKKLFLEDVELQLQLVEDQEASKLVVPSDKEQRELEMILRSLASRMEYVFKSSHKFYWN